MEAQIGDNIVFESERVGQPAHSGVIEEVLKQQPPRYPRTLGGRPRKHRGTRGGRRPDRAEEATGQALAGCTSQPVPHGRCKMGLRSRHSWTE